MGVVYAAYDPELDRKLAIKLLHQRLLSGGGGSSGQARLLAEARAMAKLAHPNVVTVFDAVTHEGQVALVMEFVDGESLGEWLAGSELREHAQLLDIFVRAARGLSAAHAAGITHRDFKPDNVMLGRDGRVRVMDFGLAHAEGAEPAADTAGLGLTEESASGSRARLTMTSFCVSLWEALYGERPFAGRTLAELTYSVTRGERRDPPHGARKLPARAQRALERGLSLRREERWPSMEALTAELLPRQSRWSLGAVSLAVVLGVAGVGGFLWSQSSGPQPCASAGSEVRGYWTLESSRALRASFQATGLVYAEESAAAATLELDAYAEQWAAVRREVCEAAVLRREVSENLHDRQVVCLDGRLREFKAISRVLAEADAGVVERSARLLAALPELSSCTNAEFLMAAVRPPEDRNLRVAVDQALGDLARIRALEVGGRYEEASADLESLRKEAQGIAYDPLAAELAIRRGSLLDYQGQYDEAESVLEAGYYAARRSGAGRSEADLAAKLTHVVGDHLQRHEEALRWGRHAEAGVDASQLGDGVRARVINNSGNVVFNQGRHEEALEIFERSYELRLHALGPEHPDTAISVANLARTYSKLGRHEEAIEMHRRGIGIRERTLGVHHPYLADSYQDLALSLQSSGRAQEAQGTQEKALELCAAALGTEHPQCAWARVLLAEMLARGGEPAEGSLATELAEMALPVLLEAHGAEHERVRRASEFLAAGDSTPGSPLLP
jgi:tetratricopeptide (TPR) repeat protein